MAVKGAKEVKDAWTKLLGEITNGKAEEAVNAVLIDAAQFAANLTPIDTSNLIGSQFREVKVEDGKVTGTLGYTAEYAAAVHGMKGTLKGQPRAHFGATGDGTQFGGGTGNGNYWDPNAEPGFLIKAFEDPDAIAQIEATIKRYMEL